MSHKAIANTSLQRGENLETDTEKNMKLLKQVSRYPTENEQQTERNTRRAIRSNDTSIPG
jgi:hypothetical protein